MTHRTFKKATPLALGAALLLGALAPAPAALADDKVVYFYNWSEYVPDGLLEQFQKETGIKVIYSTYESNETLYAKLKTHPDGYDVVVPSTYFVAKMAKEQMLQPLDRALLPNFKHLDPSLLNHEYDPGNTYSIPYIWGATGIGRNSDVVSQPVSAWKDLWAPEWKESLLLMDDAREVFHIALVQLGHSPNSRKPAEIKEAFEYLKQLMPNVKAFNSDNPADPFIAGEVNLGMLWNGSAYGAQQEYPSITFTWPEEGTILWMDNLAVTAKAKHVKEAHALINFLMRPDVAAQVAEAIGYPTPVKDAIPLLKPAFRNNPMIFPSEAIKQKGEFQSDVGEASVLYEQYFQQLKAMVAKAG
ncbi:extracellular solute-binding protein [Aeromonas simiae]|uniref:Putrescine-binding periplasmic protein n=1 Tax=Aeromonas simiae TaxID=218936 RepID=A0A5J6WV32_9GAMM|nr:extracellular solute-binding protein [Aeromonas simiae]QFI54762.1 extracellular solute-binding protein [Aeromonas simiae]